ncbi:ADP-ribosyl cyclase/cyclic ADP-ribose hydrolase 1-like [Denticeps clupeoides]|uniref:ADP-ribosyl cyclase/cyclic ADP-ribose hydrolase n=1 Tax=Denticeps clupeoides TaxID=299321 RepID=A0AAY4B0M3_9TELE|nr:ADP-ribosyl cyclase/cyclic ADP-ribose hydrolase 1-like [Denticeps clupeoides]
MLRDPPCAAPSRRRRCALLGACALLVAVTLVAALLAATIRGATPLRTAVVGRCRERTAGASPDYCEDAWNAFAAAFVGKDPCNVPPESYDRLMEAAFQKRPCNTTLFWSKTKSLAHAFTEKKRCLLTLEDTLLGYMLDGLTWCGQNGSNGIFTECPCWSCCPDNPVRSFWIRASAAFAAGACGDAYAFMNGSISSPFSSESIFASTEVKNFNYSALNSLTIVLVTRDSSTDACDGASMKSLQRALDPALKYSCRNVPQARVESCISQPDVTCSNCW